MKQWKEWDHARFRGIVVSAREGEDAEKLIRRFTKKVRNEGILQEHWDKSFYEKPSVRRRRKASKARFLKRLEETEP